MDWTESLRRAIDYMEAHLMEPISAEDVAAEVNISMFYFHKGFKIMTGYSVAEYIRYRRLYLAGLDVMSGKSKIIDLAYQYGYDAPESFTKAFSRFHGISPIQVRKNPGKIKAFLPLKIVVEIKGGYDLDYVVEQMAAIKVIGIGKMIPYEESFVECPKMWAEFVNSCSCENLNDQSERAKAVRDNMIGEFAVCADPEQKSDKFQYLIAGRYQGGPVPDDMMVTEIPAGLWAKFKCIGPMPGAIQAINAKIYKEWLPGNPEYEMAFGYNVEWYTQSDTTAADYRSEIWIPVRKK